MAISSDAIEPKNEPDKPQTKLEPANIAIIETACQKLVQLGPLGLAKALMVSFKKVGCSASKYAAAAMAIMHAIVKNKVRPLINLNNRNITSKKLVQLYIFIYFYFSN
jgi:hypothetical protein